MSTAPLRQVIKGNKFAEVPDGEVDYELKHPEHAFGPHINLIPMTNAVGGARAFYGARFSTQALPLLHREAALVQHQDADDPQGRSYDATLGELGGAIRSRAAGKVTHVGPSLIAVEDEKGETHHHPLQHFRPMNRKTMWHNTPVVKAGDTVKKDQLLAPSNFTDHHGTLAIGTNVRIGLVPYKGWSLDDALVISESLAKRMTSEALYPHDLEYTQGVEGGKKSYRSLFPTTYTQEQLDKLDDHGVAKLGQVVNPGDPLILAHQPKTISTSSAQLSNLSKHMRNARVDRTVTWDKQVPGVVTHVSPVTGGIKVNVAAEMPAQVADKLVLRTGQKGTISKILPDEHMLRGADGKPMEMLLNPLAIPSRVNNALIYELLLGKIAQKRGQPYVVPGYLPKGKPWYDFVQQELQKHGVPETDEVFDPQSNHKLDSPITTGYGFVHKLTHTAESKLSSRGQGSYSLNEAPAKGSEEMQGAKRLSGLEVYGLLSSGGYALLRDAATIRGTRNDEYWSKVRRNIEPGEPGAPFAFRKLKALLNGSGLMARSLGGGRERLQFMTDRDTERMDPIEVQNGGIVDLNSMEPVPGGLFDKKLTGSGRWGYFKLPHAMPNPMAETSIRKLLDLTQAEFDDILAGRKELPPHLHPIRPSKPE